MMTRVQAIRRVMEHAAPDDLVLTTTGMVSREACMIDDRPGNFYMLGSMGLLSSLGLGLSLLAPERRVFILEGDGSALMSLGALALIASQRPRNLVHVILDNESYESTGGQPTISREVDLARVGESCGYQRTARIRWGGGSGRGPCGKRLRRSPPDRGQGRHCSGRGDSASLPPAGGDQGPV